MQELASVQEHLEDYLKGEGLFGVMPEYRRPSLSGSFIVYTWLIGLWILAILLVLRTKGSSGLTAALLGPILLFLGTFLLLVVFFVARELHLGKKLENADAGFIGQVFLFGFPLVLAVWLGLYTRSFWVVVWYLVLGAAGLATILLLHGQRYRLRLLVELARSTLRVFMRTAALLPVLAPILLVVVLLSVFSQELWQALGDLSTSRLLGSTLLMIFPVLLLIIASLDKETKGIVGEFPDKAVLIERAQAAPFVRERLQSGLISKEEWSAFQTELAWRDESRLAADLLPPVQKRVKRWLALLLLMTHLGLATSFLVYFSIFFSVLLKPLLVASWVNLPLESMILPLKLGSYTWEFDVPNTFAAIVKVSLAYISQFEICTLRTE
jgi:hypothetical protein